MGLHPGLDPGLYVCAGGHLHVKGVVQNLADVTLASVRLEGRAYDTQGNLLGTASPARTSPALVSLNPGEKREFDLEFLTVTGSKIGRVDLPAVGRRELDRDLRRSRAHENLMSESSGLPPLLDLVGTGSDRVDPS